MTRKTVLSTVLLVFVGVSLIVVAGLRRRDEGRVASEASSTVPQLTAIYFHAPHRCPTCRKIEAYAHEALQPGIERGDLTWQIMDYTAPENAELVKQFKVMTSTVVLAEKRGDKIVRWKSLDDVWDYTHDQAKFAAFMHDAWNVFHKES